MRALQVQSAFALVADFQGRFLVQALFDGGGPLLNVLRRLKGIESGKARHCPPDYRGGEIETGDGRSGGVALISLGENNRNVVQLIAPSVHVDRRIEYTVSGAHDQSRVGHVVGNADTGRKTKFVRV